MDATVTRGPVAESGQVIASYASYDEAQRAVDKLSDAGFPVEHTQIVGLDLRIVEAVTGRLTNARAAVAGAATGAWLGVLFGVLVGLFTAGPEWVGLIIGGAIIGTFWGAIFGFFAHWATGGRRDFSSTRGLIAARYELRVADAHAARAREMLSGSLLGGTPAAQPPDR
jgi:hypothetical protein